MAEEGKIYSLNFIPVGTADEETSDHKVAVNENDTDPNFLFEKQAPTSQIGFIEDSNNPGKFLVLLDKNNPDEPSQGANLLRCITPFSPQQIDTVATGFNGSQEETKIIIYPITISIGEIKGVSFMSRNNTDMANIDRLQIAILSNTRNNIAGSKLEYFGQWGYPSGDTLLRGNDWKSYNMIEGSRYNNISDLGCNYHFVAILIHFNTDAESSSQMGVLAKSIQGSPLVEAGRNMNYCGQLNNRKSIINSLVNETTMTVPNDFSIETNLQTNFPYIEFYQVRGS